MEHKELNEAILTAFSKDFCTELEFQLSRAFYNAGYGDSNGMWWCDGIEAPVMSYQPFNISQTIVTMAWLGHDGQDCYNMTIKLGKLTRKHCKLGLSLNECIPGDDTLDWVTLDIENAKIELRLK